MTDEAFVVNDADRKAVDGSELAERLGIDGEEIAWRKSFNRFDGADVPEVELLLERVAVGARVGRDGGGDADSGTHGGGLRGEGSEG